MLLKHILVIMFLAHRPSKQKVENCRQCVGGKVSDYIYCTCIRKQILTIKVVFLQLFNYAPNHYLFSFSKIKARVQVGIKEVLVGKERWKLQIPFSKTIDTVSSLCMQDFPTFYLRIALEASFNNVCVCPFLFSKHKVRNTPL